MKLYADQPRARGLFSLLSHFAFGLLLSLVLVTPFVQMSGTLTDDQRAFRLYGYGVLMSLQITLLFLRNWRTSVRILTTPVLGALIWFGLSLTWAEHTNLPSRRVALLWLVYTSVLSGVCDLGYRRSLGVVTILLLVSMVVNYVVVFAFPDLGTQHWRDITQWRGFMAHKNIAGMTCAVTVLILAQYDNRKLLAVRLAGGIAALAFLYFTGSRTAMLALLVAAPLGLYLSRLKEPVRKVLRDRQHSLTLAAWLILALVLVLLSILTIQREALISMTDDARAVALRSSIWRPMIQYYLEHPFLGSGYGAYWDASKAAINTREFGTQEWLKDVDQGHNGYLDLLVQTGVPGLALALYAAMVWPLTRFGTIAALQPRKAALLFSLIAFIIVGNLTESSLFADDTLGNVFLLFALAQVHRFDLRVESERGRHNLRRGNAKHETN